MYYADKIESLTEIFGVEVRLEAESLYVGQKCYPIIDDVIILIDPAEYPAAVRQRLQARAVVTGGDQAPAPFAEDIQYSFGHEWQTYSQVLAEHQQEFDEYFDLVDLEELQDRRVCDLGCGSGRWSYHLRHRCRELVMVDFSEAIFVARDNLSDSPHTLFFMGDLTRLPFADNFADFLFCLGVLHTLPMPSLPEVRKLKRFAPKQLFYIYYALDNRPVYFRWLLSGVTMARLALSRVRQPAFRRFFARAGAIGIYLPLILIGRLLQPFHLSRYVPLYEVYQDKSVSRIQQDVYDRFFTGIEQRVTREEVLELEDTFERVVVSNGVPYWHFLCYR